MHHDVRQKLVVMMQNWSEKLLGIGLLSFGFFVVVLRQAWRLSHEGGFDLFSMETLRELEPYFVMWIIFTVLYVIWLYSNNRQRSSTDKTKRN